MKSIALLFLFTIKGHLKNCPVDGKYIYLVYQTAAGYKIDSHWQPVFRYDWAREGLASPVAIPDRFKSHREVAGGLNYWINPKAVVKFSYHHVDGNLLSLPRGEIDLSDLTFPAIPKTTDLATFGLSFVF